MKELLNLIASYPASTPQEIADQRLMTAFIEAHPNATKRSNLAAHVTSSIVILNTTYDHVLMGYHQIYQSWGWFGGHNDGDEDCYRVALKEAQEETGLSAFVQASQEIVALDVIYVENHLKQGQYVPDHLHLNVSYGFIADDRASLKHNPHEHQGLRWFPLDTYLHSVKETRMKPIYEKIIARMLAKKG